MNNQRSTHEPKRASASATFMLLVSLIISPVLLPPQSVAQSNEVPQSNEIDARATQVQSGVAPKPKAPIGAVSFGYIYIASEDTPGCGTTTFMASLEFRRST
jgi:hypothetical protein